MKKLEINQFKKGQGLRLTLDLNSNWVSHGTLPSDKQANIGWVDILDKNVCRLHWWYWVDHGTFPLSESQIFLSPLAEKPGWRWEKSKVQKSYKKNYKNENFYFCLGQLNYQLGKGSIKKENKN